MVEQDNEKIIVTDGEFNRLQRIRFNFQHPPELLRSANAIVRIPSVSFGSNNRLALPCRIEHKALSAQPSGFPPQICLSGQRAMPPAYVFLSLAAYLTGNRSFVLCYDQTSNYKQSVCGAS